MDLEAQIQQEQIVREGISMLIDEVCRKAADIYPNICSRANRSMDDKRKIIDLVFELVTAENSTMTPESALAQIEGELDWTQE